MNQSHVTSLELSKKLKEAGVEQRSEFYWYDVTNEDIDEENWEVISKYELGGMEGFAYSAFLASELAEMLPKHCPKHGTPMQICRSFSDGWFVGYGNHMDGTGCHVEDGKTLSDALGEMVLYLKQKNLLKEASV